MLPNLDFIRARLVKAVVFDLDGTLVDTMDLVPQAYADTIRSLGGPDVSPRQVVDIWHIGASPVVLEHFLGRALSPDDLACYHRHIDAALAGVEPFPGVPELLRALQQDGYLPPGRVWGLQLACRRLGVDPAATVYVGDAEVDLRCATAAGASAVHVRWSVAGHPVDVLKYVRGRGGQDVEPEPL